MKVASLVTEPVGNAGEGIVAGGKIGYKGGKITGDILGKVIGGLIGLGGGAWAVSSMLAGLPVIMVTGLAILGGVAGAAALGWVAGKVGGVGGELGGGWLGMAVGGLVGTAVGMVKGVQKAFGKSSGDELKSLQAESKASDIQLAQTAEYIRQQQMREAAMSELKQGRAETQLALANPDARTDNAAKVGAQVSDPAKSAPAAAL